MGCTGAGQPGVRKRAVAAEMLVTSVGDQWTNKNGIWGSSSQKFVFLRNKLSLDKPVEKVIASVTAASTETTQQYVYQFYVNGQLVGLGPSVKNLSDLYYNTYDITSLLNQGENILGAVCYAEDKQGFLCQITAFYEDGTKEVLCNSGSNPVLGKLWMPTRFMVTRGKASPAIIMPAQKI